jgi:drug/metabolite transporter (DMT)-like permease
MTRTSNTKITGIASLLGGALVTGSFGLWVHWVSPMFGTATQTVCRFALAASIVCLMLGIRRKRNNAPKSSIPLSGRVVWFVVLLGLATFGLGMLYTTAVHLNKIASAMSLLSAGSIITALFVGSVFLHEKLTTGRLLAITVALAGLMLYANGFEHFSLGILVGLCAGACDGISNCLRKVLRGTDRLAVVMFQYTIAGVLTLPFVWLSGQQAIKHVSTWAIVALLLYAVLSVSLGNLLLAGFARLDANVGAVVMASQIFFAMLLGILVLHEFPTRNEFAGGLLIFSASFFAVADVGKLRGRIWRKKPAAAYELGE